MVGSSVVDVLLLSPGLGRRNAHASSPFGLAYATQACHLHQSTIPLSVEAPAPHSLMMTSDAEGHARFSRDFPLS
jgi:hypothetical protein